MKQAEYKAFCECKNKFKAIIEDIQKELPDLQEIQQRLMGDLQGYTVRTPVVYNEALDDVTENDDIRLILIGDNPGRREQEKRRYLVGPSGKIAESFFERTLSIDFRKNIIILNKTPVHTPRTAGLKELCRVGGEKLKLVIDDSQIKMARLAADFFCALHVPIWICGYSEMKKNGIFESYTAALRGLILSGIVDKNSVYIYRHFSMNQFTIDLRQKMQKYASGAVETLRRIGTEYREKILGV
ncbi:MAG: uracil-DNA glycosylase family protein [Spirochaetaceae bacterium]|jgi:hypothetical protein|nr:uracil-DNA glycosylase family protein [Spirochaetaceae bacterium]